jgi:hypothetical protein
MAEGVKPTGKLADRERIIFASAGETVNEAVNKAVNEAVKPRDCFDKNH